MRKDSITAGQYGYLQSAFDYFNTALFGGSLSGTMLTIARKANSKGFLRPVSFTKKTHKGVDTGEFVSEISLNPDCFSGDEYDKSVMSTLVHEMAHHWQLEHGVDVPRKGYHNREWADKMKSIGLQPVGVDRGKRTGRETGHLATHDIIEGGKFDRACNGFFAVHGRGLVEGIKHPEQGKSKSGGDSKTPWQCPKCRDRAWGKPSLVLVCGKCHVQFEKREA